jgi:hypothetical protein
MNRLNGLAAYLSGPIDFAEDMGAGWRNDITPFLEDMNLRVLDPLKHCFYGAHNIDTVKRPLMAKLEKEGRFEELREEMKEVNHWDLRAVDLSSVVIVNYDINVHMCGTYEEIFKANNQVKPVLLVLSVPRTELPSWIIGRIPQNHMFDSWEDLRSYLTAIDSDPKYRFTQDDEKRWVFFEGEHMYDESLQSEELFVL